MPKHPGNNTGSSWAHGQQPWDVLPLCVASQIRSSKQKAPVGPLVGPCGAQRVSSRFLYTWTDRLNRIIQCESQKVCPYHSQLYPHGGNLYASLSPHLVSLMTAFSAWTMFSEVTVRIFRTIPASLLANFSALSGCSADRGTITMGTAWHRPS